MSRLPDNLQASHTNPLQLDGNPDMASRAKKSPMYSTQLPVCKTSTPPTPPTVLSEPSQATAVKTALKPTSARCRGAHTLRLRLARNDLEPGNRPY